MMLPTAMGLTKAVGLSLPPRVPTSAALPVEPSASEFIPPPTIRAQQGPPILALQASMRMLPSEAPPPPPVDPGGLSLHSLLAELYLSCFLLSLLVAK